MMRSALLAAVGLALAAAQGSVPSTIPSQTFPPQCSIAPQVKAQMPASKVVSITDGKNKRCISVVAPSSTSDSAPMPILFSFHGSGGNAGNFGGRSDTSGVSIASLAKEHGFGVIGGEAIQWSGKNPGPPGPGPGPSPVPADCKRCFTSKGCAPGPTCTACVKRNQGPCTSTCGKEGVPFPLAMRAVCGGSNATAAVAPPSSWHGGQWLIPEVQNDTTGLRCDWTNDRDLVYIKNAVAALESFGGGGVFDTSKVFFTGCSMGSAFTIWLAQCYKQLRPEAVTAFATQSTGLKVKGDGLRFPADNYNKQYGWGECPACKYFPAPVTKVGGLKACFVDQTGDNDFYKSTLAMHKAWIGAGMRGNISISGGGHCATASYTWIANCLDDGTGRLLGK